jgi:uncharacterized repeat protein (TIGR01451 family)
LLLGIDIGTKVETSVNMGHGGMGVAVDEVSGYVYVTGGCTGDDLSVWDPNPWTLLQSTGDIGNPAGICIPQAEVAYNPLHLTKDDGLGGACVDPGNNITYSICYNNTANNFDVHNVTLFDTLPPEVTFVSATGGGVYDGGTHTVSWDIGTLPAGAPEACVQLVVNVDSGTAPGTTITNKVEISGDETGVTDIVEQTDVCAGPPPPVPSMNGWYALATVVGLVAAMVFVLRRQNG